MRNKTVFITGASGGIGAAIAERFAKEGFQLLLTCRHSIEKLLQMQSSFAEKYGITCDIYQADISNYVEVSHLFDSIYLTHPTIDIVINNAGISHIGLLSDMAYEEWNTVINTNLSSVFACCKQVIPSMVREKNGRIINISSVWGEVGASCEVAYSASKGAMNAFTKALAKELAPSNIQVNALSLGAIATKMNDFLSEEERLDLIQDIPANRLGSVDEVADAVYFLATTGSYLTGQVIRLDGGWI